MTRFFRSALFPLIVIVLLVYLASQTLIPQQKSAKKVTYSELIQRVQDDPKSIELVEFNPKKQQIVATLANENDPKIKVNYPTPQSQIDFQRRIAIKNVSDPDPPGWVSFLLGTHPTTMQRIGQAKAAARASSRDG